MITPEPNGVSHILGSTQQMDERGMDEGSVSVHAGWVRAIAASATHTRLLRLRHMTQATSSHARVLTILEKRNSICC